MHVDDGRGFRGGQQQVLLLVRELAARGVAQSLLAQAGGELAARAAAEGLPLRMARLGREWQPGAARPLREAARDLGANLIHAHTGHAHALALRAARGAGARLVTTRRVDFQIGRGWFSRRKYLAPGQHFIAISHGVRDVLVGGGVDPRRIDVVHSGVPPIAPQDAVPRERVRRELGIGAEEWALVNVGALTDHKGQRYLIEAAPAILSARPSARIHILGEGELRGRLERLITERGVGGRVVLHGHVADARFKLGGFDMYVSSSHLEGLGTIILDAMQSGLPVVAAAAGGVPEIVIDGETGWLAPPCDPLGLARAVHAAMAEPDAARARAERARARVARGFTAQAMAEGTLAVYRRLLLAEGRDEDGAA